MIIPDKIRTPPTIIEGKCLPDKLSIKNILNKYLVQSVNPKSKKELKEYLLIK